MKSTISQTASRKIEALPEAIQQEILDYIDFLIEKYQIEISDSDLANQNDVPSADEKSTARRQPQKLEFW
jgi:hypothetical protein